MKTYRSLPAFFGILATLVAAPAMAAFPVVSSTTVAGSGGGADAIYGLTQDASGNLYTAGYLTLAGGSDIWVAKYSPALVLLSSYTYDRNGFSDSAWGVGVDTQNGNVFVAGSISTAGANTSSDIWIAKFNSSLVLLTSVTVNGSGNDRDEAYGMRVVSGSLYVVGRSSVTSGASNWVARYDENLVLLSSTSLLQYDPYTYDIMPLASGNIFVAGSRAPNSVTSVDAWIGKYNSSLVLLSSTTVVGPAGGNDHFHRLADDGSGGVFAVGYLNTATAEDRFIQHYDANLVRVSSSLANGLGNSVESVTDIHNTSNGTLLVSGYISDIAGAGGINAFIAEYSTGLALISSASYRSSGSGTDRAASILIGANQDVYAAGWMTEATQDAWLARLSTNPSYGMVYPGCAVTNNVGAGQTYATISSAVAALPATLTGNSCVVIRDGATYAEQVTVQGFTNNGYTITILADPASGLTPVISPPLTSTAAFLIANASVSVQGINIAPTNAIPYGIFISSTYVQISSVNVQDAGGKIATAGVAASSWTTVSYTSVTMGGANAIGIWLPGSVMTSVTRSTAVASGVTAYALRLAGASSNSISDVFLQNLPGTAAYLLNSDGNAVSRSSIACDNGTGNNPALYLTNSSSNSVTGTFLRNWFSDGISLNSGSNYNTIAQSTSVLRGAAGQAAIDFTGSSYNSVSGCLLTAVGGLGVNLGTSNSNTITQTTMSITSGMGYHALRFNVASSNTVTQCYVSNPGDTAVAYQNGAAYNVLSQSTIIGGPSSNANPSGVNLLNGSFNTITQSNISNPGGYGVTFDSWAVRNTISMSTITGAAVGYSGLFFNSGSATNTVSNSYVQGSTAAFLINSVGSTIDSSVLIATSPTGNALWLTGGSVNLTLVADTLIGGQSGAGVFLDSNNTGAIVFSSNTIKAARYGLLISTQSAGASLAVTTMTFASLASGATAVQFTGGTFVSTFTAMDFDSSVAVNVNGSLMNTASRITLNAHAGARAGAAYENDPNSLVDWQSVSAPNAPSGFAGVTQSSTSILWSWTDNSSDETGFRVKLGGSNLSGDLATNVTTWLQTAGLTANTTSGSLLAQAFNSTGTADSGSLTLYTLSEPPNSITATFYGSSAAFTWPTMTNPPSTRWSVERGTDGVSYASQLYFSSAAAAYTDNTGMSLGTSYYYRIRSANGDGVYSAHANASAIIFTGGGVPSSPSAFAGTAQSTTSILWSWTDNSSIETGFRIMAGATNVSGDLAINATTWIQTGLAVNTSSGALFVQTFNSTGTTNSGSVTRYSLAAVPTGLAAAGVTASSATISWSGSATQYQLERSTGAAYTMISSGTATSFGNTGLAGASTYYYRVFGLNGDLIATANTSTITVVTQPTPTPPNAPTAFAGTAQSTTSIFWSWTDNSSDETGFRIMAGATNVSGNLAINATTWLQAGLAVNTSSGALFVQAFNLAGTTNSVSVTRYSLAAVPTGLAAAGVTLSSATISWSGSATQYQLERSTGAVYTMISSGTATSYGNTGLTVASTYYYRVFGLNGDLIATANTSTITVVTQPPATPPIAPTGFAGVAQSSSSILWSWTDNSSEETGYRVMSGAVNVSGTLAGNATTWLQTGLSANTSSQLLFVQVYNSTGTGNSASLSRYTLAAAPSGLASSSVFLTSATVSWTAGNPAGTTFELERSTGTGFGLRISSAVTAYTDTSLANGATCSFRVRAVNAEAIATAYSSSITFVTFPILPPAAPTGFAGTAQSAASIFWSWTDNADNEDGYRVLTGTISLSGDLAMNATTWLQTGLAINTISGPLSVQVFNATATVNSGTASRTTLAATPSALAAAGVYLSSGTLSWNANGNLGGTVYQLQRSTGTGFGQQFAGSATYYIDQYLTASTTYFYRVLALNNESVSSPYSSSITVVTVLAPPIPGAVGSLAGAALGTSSASWTWALVAGATNYYLFRPSDNSYLGASTTGPFVQAALSPNTAYGMRVAGINYGGTGPLSSPTTVYTFAAVPTAAAAASITSTTVVASWSLAGNPPATVAQLYRSTDAVTYSALTAAAVTSYSDADLLGCTTYYYRVRHMNGDGFGTPYSTFSALTSNTLPSPPAGLSAAANAGGTVGLSWGLSPTEGVTGYRLYWDAGTGTVSYGAAIAVLTSTETAYTTGVLTSSAAYIFSLRAAHRCGGVETTGALALSGAATAPAAVRAAIKEPDSGRRINGNRVTILGELIAGTPGDVQQVLFQYKLATSTAWTDVDEANVNHTNPDFSFPYFVHADVTVMPAGSYDLRAVAYNTAGVPDPTPPAVRVVVDPVTPDISESETVDGKIKKNQTISNTVTSVVDTCGAGESDPAVRVTIPPGIVSNTTATVSVIANPTITTAAPTGQTFVGSAIKIDLSNGQTALNGTAEITLTYPDTVLFPSLLQIYYLNEATGQWSRDFASTVNTSSRTISGRTPHFSTFAILLGASFGTDLSNVRAYPVPFMPNGVHADEGRAFSASDPNSGIIFSNLPSGSEIRIYTLTGRLVASLDNPALSGTVRWDVRNQDGRDVASGPYFAVITASGHKSVVKKLVIIR